MAACTTALLAVLAPGASAHADADGPDDRRSNVQQNVAGSRCGALPDLVTSPVGLPAPKLCE
ncbi:hypothetical protein ACFQMH_41025 [Streptomyces viridiviolaceus]|uniref:Chaplin domain-containing protein n=1 Tax=Streptomyces viridiviolaceus TaxID=68282 RepID=A0ABW2EDC1_9ACTN|nr:hypothetical protein [Streptomyces viridiviolaceus]